MTDGLDDAAHIATRTLAYPACRPAIVHIWARVLKPGKVISRQMWRQSIAAQEGRADADASRSGGQGMPGAGGAVDQGDAGAVPFNCRLRSFGRAQSYPASPAVRPSAMRCQLGATPSMKTMPFTHIRCRGSGGLEQCPGVPP